MNLVMEKRSTEKDFRQVEAVSLNRLRALSRLLYKEFCATIQTDENTRLLALGILLASEERYNELQNTRLCFHCSEIFTAFQEEIPDSFSSFMGQAKENLIAALQQSGFYFFRNPQDSHGFAYFWVWLDDEQALCFSLARFGSLQLELWRQLTQRQNRVEQDTKDFWNEELLSHSLDVLSGQVPQSQDLLQECLRKLCASRLFLITGGPGSGKTTLLASLLSILRHAEQNWGGRELQFALSAPTARAAQRMLESLRMILPGNSKDIEAQTLHKLLSLGWSRAKCYRPATSSLPLLNLDLLIVDEASMLDSEMALQLLSSMHFSTRLVLIGDSDQLPAVGLGNFWQDLLLGVRNNAQNLLQLKGSYRSVGEIRSLSQDILGGDRVAFLRKFAEPGSANLSWQCIEEPSPSEWAQYLWEHWCPHKYWQESKFPEDLLEDKSLLRDKLEPLFAWMKEYNILSPLQKGMWGARYINQLLLAVYRKQGRVEQRFFHGCPLQITKNNYQLGLYNGDRGFCLQIGPQFYTVFVHEQDSYQIFPMSQLVDCEASFVQTIHKSQGSEYQNVCLLLPEPNPKPEASPNIWSRALLYTAATRAKEKLCLVGSKAALQIAGEVMKPEDATEKGVSSLLSSLLAKDF